MKKRKYGAAKIVFVLLIGTFLLGCKEKKEEKEKQAQLFFEESCEFGDVKAPKDFDWKKWDGEVLNFVCEDNISAHILAIESQRFTEVTGIKVNIKSMDFNTLKEKINIDFISQTAQYDLIYVDPYQTLNRFDDSLEDLSIYENNPNLPHLVGGMEGFSKEQVDICSFFETDDKLCAVPFDTTTMILFYRQDIFEKYSVQMKAELGYDPMPGTTGFTWERYIEVAEWITENVPEEEVKNGSIIMSAKDNSIYTAFSSVLGSYGGDYFTEKEITEKGSKQAGILQTDTLPYRKSLEIFKRLINLNPKERDEWTWGETTTSFINGEAAMMINWDENTSAVENIENSSVAGKVGYSILPYGDMRSANIYGGSGIGINCYASEEKKNAAWLFIVWATSPEVQMKTFLEKDGGNLPTSKRLQNHIRNQKQLQTPQVQTTLMVQQEEYAYYRPKMKQGYEFETIIIQNLRDMLNEDVTEESTAIKMRSQWNEERAKKNEQ